DDWQHAGVGTALIDALLPAARLAGIDRLWLVQAHDNVGMRHLAAHAGFRAVPYEGGLAYAVDLQPAPPVPAPRPAQRRRPVRGGWILRGLARIARGWKGAPHI